MFGQTHFYLKSYCCVCLKYNNLFDLNCCDKDGTTYKTKLCISFPDLESSNDNEIPSYICVTCADNLDNVYKFRLMFVHTRKFTLNYLKELKNVPNNKYNKLYVDVLDIKTLLPADINISQESTKEESCEETNLENKEEYKYWNIYKEFAPEDRPDKLTEVGTNFLGFSPVTIVCKSCKGLRKDKQKKFKARVVCQICKKSYSSDAWLKKHQLTHYEPKRPDKRKCTICRRQMVSTAAMANHLKMHHAEECFSCGAELQNGDHHVCKPRDKCAKCNQFLGKDKHLCKDFKCVLCPLEFKQQRYMRRHLKRHLNVKRYKCGFCDETFDKKDLLEKHIISQHIEV